MKIPLTAIMNKVNADPSINADDVLLFVDPKAAEAYKKTLK